MGPDLLHYPPGRCQAPLLSGHRRLWVRLSVTVSFAQPIRVTLNCSISVHVCIFSIKDNLASRALAHKSKEYESPQSFLPREHMPDDCCAFYSFNLFFHIH